jgi:hypothetical protein
MGEVMSGVFSNLEKGGLSCFPSLPAKRYPLMEHGVFPLVRQYSFFGEKSFSSF